ncbi:MAG: glycoside hydrolase family 43 protein [Armatimonadota bacterium]|jgi:beta-xylosidase
MLHCLMLLSVALAVLLLPAAGAQASGQSGPTYTNPVGGDIRMGDPFVLLHEGTYYLYGTTAGDGFKCWRSPDLVHWKPLGYAYRRADDSWGRGSFWAPEVFRHRGRFYMAFSCRRDRDRGYRLCLAAADSPEGPFWEVHAPWCDIGWSCIDAHVFIDDDGTPYLYFAKVGVVGEPWKEPSEGYLYGMIYALRLEDDLSAPAGEPVLCVRAEQEWEDPDSMHSRCNEGAFVLKRGGRYYMTYSAGHYASPRYGIGCATAPSPLGPWTKSSSNPLACTRREIGVSGPGHNSITTSPDGTQLFMVYHAHADPKQPSGNRTVNIDRIVFDGDGDMKLIGPTRTPQPMPSGAAPPG